MDVIPVVPQGRQVIQGYGDGGFRISGQRHEGSVLVLPLVTGPWPVTAIEALTIASLNGIDRPDILLIGTGRRLVFPPHALRRHFEDLGVSLDVMDTGAACRTFNVLIAEERRVAAALIAV